MSSYYQFNHQHPTPVVPGASNNHHGGRSNRSRGTRLSVSQNSHKQFRGVKSMKELTETASINAFRTKYEAGRSFDLEDDMEFCPGLLTDSDMNSIHSASERSSLASNSPESSPTQQPQTVAPGFSLNSSSPAFIPPPFPTHHSLKIHQPSARARNAIPIVNPATGITMSSPPPSVSPARMQQGMGRRW